MLEQLFTRQERQALAFLLAAVLFGLGIMAWNLCFRRPAESSQPAAVSVNRAGEPELVSLPGIGPVTAHRIVEHRRLHGSFLTLQDLARVKGISRKTLARLRGLVRFD